MEMDHLMSVMDLPPGHGKKLVQEMEELGKLRTDLMIAKCQIKNEVIMCPIPRKLTRSHREHNNELKVTTDLSDSITSAASPPYYAGSPPIRESNPLIRDSLFRGQMV